MIPVRWYCKLRTFYSPVFYFSALCSWTDGS